MKLDINFVVNNNLIGTDAHVALNGPLRTGQSVVIEVALDKLGDVRLALAIIEELHHVFYAGTPRQDEPHYSDSNKTVFNAIFPEFSTSGQLGALSPAAMLYGDGLPSPSAGQEGVFLTSNDGGSHAIGSIDSTVFSGTGSDTFLVGGSAGLVEIVDGGGDDTLAMNDVAHMSRVSARRSSDGTDLGIYVDGRLAVVSTDADGTGMIEHVTVAGVTADMATILSPYTNAAPSAADQYVDIFGAHSGGTIAATGATDADGDTLSYSLVGLSGAYADQAWSVDRQTGAVQAHFYRADAPGSEFSFVTVRVTDGLDVKEVGINIRWARQGETTPEFAMPASNQQGEFVTTDLTMP